MNNNIRIENGRCTCTCADTCPLGKTGMAANCSEAELASLDMLEPADEEKTNPRNCPTLPGGYHV
jgi:hypothetical protein